VGHDDGRYRLLRGLDPAKDQSYVLHMLGQEELARVLLPIGEFTKPEVREHASRLGLRTAAKPDSQDICFVKDDYRTFLRENFPAVAQPGSIVDTAGAVVGSHEGTIDFTIGQRKGLGVAFGEPRYVVDLQPATREGLSVKVRYRAKPVAASLEHDGGGFVLRFRDPQEAVAPGQAAVLYAGDEVVGGGTIAEVIR
jgi:tRNA-specific 2-thiouridylase